MPYSLHVAEASLCISAALAALFLMHRARRMEELRQTQHRMIADLAHNLQTPLAVLRGKIERLESSMLHDGQTIGLRQSVDSLSHFVRDLLAYSSLQESSGYTRETFSLSELVHEVYDEIKDIAESQLIVLTVHAPTPVHMHGYRMHIRDALMNVISNAIKYMGTSSIRRISISLENRGGQILLSVMDTGMGISEQDLPHIFERFYRGGNRVYGSVQGTGLGLAIVERIVQKHGGAITVSSEPGKGSTFTLVLPPVPPGRLRSQWLSR